MESELLSNIPKAPIERELLTTILKAPMHNCLRLVNLVQFGLSLKYQSFWIIVFFQAENLNIFFHRWLLYIYIYS